MLRAVLLSFTSLLFVTFVACESGDDTSDSDTDAEVPLTACTGAGDASLSIGDASGGSFAAWADGASVGLTTSPTNETGVDVWFSATGLDASQQVTAVIDVSVDTFSETAIGGMIMDCDEEGPAVGSSFVPLPTGAPSDAGTSATMFVTITDQRGVAVTGEKTVTFR